MLTAAHLVKKFPTFYGTQKAHYCDHNIPLGSSIATRNVSILFNWL
jgi:hypothetical protein